MTVNRNHGLAIKSVSKGREYWADLVKESQESNLSKRDFCEQKGIPISAYYYWKKRLSETLPSAKAPFVEISRFLQNSAITGNDDIFSFSISNELQLIGNTRTTSGLRVKAKLDNRKYPTGVLITKDTMIWLSGRAIPFPKAKSKRFTESRF